MKGLYRFRNSRIWWFRFTREGKRHAISLGTDDEALAITKARGIIVEDHFSPKTSQGIAHFITEYLLVAQERAKKPLRPHTAKRRRYVIEMFARERNIEFIGQINHKEIEDWLKSGKRGAETIHTYSRTLKTFCAYLVRNKLVRSDLLDNFDIPERGSIGRKNWLKVDEVARVIRASNNDTLTFILLAGFHAGLRRNEICNARVQWFDLADGLLHVQNGEGFVLKDRENRTVKLSRSFKEFLNDFLAGRNKDEFAIKPEKTQSLWRYRYDFDALFTSHMRRCGVKCSIHDMRRSFASNLVSAGESIYIVARWLGDGVSVVERSYGHLAPESGDINRLVAE